MESSAKPRKLRTRPTNSKRRYESLLRLSEVLSQLRDPEDISTVLSEQLRECLQFLRFYIVVYEENSEETAWAVFGQEKKLVAVYANTPVQQRPSWQAYATQEPVYIRDWDTDPRLHVPLKQGIVDHGLDIAPLIFVPMTTAHRRLGALGMSGLPGTTYSTQDISFLRLIGRVVATALSDTFNLKHAETAQQELEYQNEKLRRTERELREVIETIPVMAWSATADGSAEFFNRRWLEYAGFTAAQAQGVGWTTALHPDDLKGLINYWQEVLAAGHAGEAEARLRRFDGEYRWFLFRTTPLVDDSGRIIRWYGINIDIEERKRAEDDLIRSEGYLRQAQRLAQVGSWAWRVPDKSVLHMSAECYRICDFDPKEGAPTWERRLQHIHPDDRPLLQTEIGRAIAERSDYDIELRFVTQHSPIKYVHSIGHPVFDSSGNLLEYVGVVMDINDKKRAEREIDGLRRLQADLAHINRVSTMGEMAASLAHEITQPIGAAVTNAEACLRLLDRDEPDLPEAREAASEMTKDARRAANIIDRVRLLYQKGSPQLQKVDVNELIGEMVTALRNEADRHSVRLHTDLSNDFPTVIADRVQMQQVLLNLILNSIEAIRGINGEVCIASRLTKDGQLEISVSDNGVGFPAGTAEKIFDAFFTTKDQGTGLGLAIVRSIVESHGGRIRATPNAGKGAAFHVTLPVE